MLLKRTCSCSLFYLLCFLSHAISKEKDITTISLFLSEGCLYTTRKDFVFSVQMSSSIVCSIDVQLVWLILFCIVVITNRGLSCTVYLLTGQSYVRDCKENDTESVGMENLNTLGAGS